MAAFHPRTDDDSDLADEERPRVRHGSPPPESVPQPVFDELTEAQCHVILDRNRVGRLAFAFNNQLDIAPVHFIRKGPWLYGRTAPGTKLTTLAHAPWVAFEVDEIEGLFNWRSVVVHGAFYRLTPGGTSYDVGAWETGIEALRELVPGSFTKADPVPFRMVMFRISIDRISGRSATPGA
jgi:nitroimidazol reductase NimA-like FMN-containing flavoprotein (pyridoxamine 5'-phosphate oxidase superfamily)